MSYDLCCYKPISETADLTEAREVVERLQDEEEAGQIRESTGEIREKIVLALQHHNPRLQRFVFDFAAIAASDNVSEEEAQSRFQHAELNTPEGDLAVQLTVYDDHVDLTVPYWYKGEKAEQVFSQIAGYLKVIREAAGFFVYDPQQDAAFDPATTDLSKPDSYEQIVRSLPSMTLKAVSNREGKPWWKFW